MMSSSGALAIGQAGAEGCGNAEAREVSARALFVRVAPVLLSLLAFFLLVGGVAALLAPQARNDKRGGLSVEMPVRIFGDTRSGQPVTVVFALTNSSSRPVTVVGATLAGGLYMSQIMTYPSFSIRKVTRTAGQIGDNLLIEFEFDPRDNPDSSKTTVTPKAIQGATPKAARKSRHWIETSPNQAWAVQAQGMDRSRGLRDPGRKEIAYSGSLGEVPMLRRVSIHLPAVGTTRVLEVQKIEFGPIPEREFTLSAYGLPELNTSSRGRAQNHLAMALFLGALVALFVAIALRFLSTRPARKR